MQFNSLKIYNVLYFIFTIKYCPKPKHLYPNIELLVVCDKTITYYCLFSQTIKRILNDIPNWGVYLMIVLNMEK